MNTTLIIALGIGLGLVCVALVIVPLRVRASVEGRIQELADGLGQASELASTLDPEAILDRMLDAAVALPGVEAVLVVLGTDPATRETRASGLSEDEVERTLLQLSNHPNLQALEITYRYRDEESGNETDLPHAAIVVALRSENELIGSLAAITRAGSGSFSPATFDALDALARRAGPALENARRYSEARELAELDSLTGLHNRRLFYEFLAREIARAHRYERHLALIVLDLDDFKRINDRIGHLGGDSVLADVAERIRLVVRTTDIPCRVGGDEFAVILPESTRDDAELLADRLGQAVRGLKIEKIGALKISAGVGELRHTDTAADLFTRADNALYRAKKSGKARTVSD